MSGADELGKFLGKRVAKHCPNGHPFVVRRNRDTGEYFLGCSQYPECRETDEIPVSLILKAQGNQELPGFE